VNTVIYIYIITAVGAAAHAYMFGRWLFKNGNRAGAFAVYVIAVTCVALPIYRYIIAP
jgi:hypothetical protein